MNNEELKEELNREGSAAEEKEAESAGTGDGDRTGEFKEAAEAEKTAEPEETGKSGGAESAAAAETTEEDEALNTKYMRLMADFQNYKRRVEKEKSDIYAFANEKLVSEQLAVIDNFERALMVETADTGFAEGMKLIFKQLTRCTGKSWSGRDQSPRRRFRPELPQCRNDRRQSGIRKRKSDGGSAERIYAEQESNSSVYGKSQQLAM